MFYHFSELANGYIIYVYTYTRVRKRENKREGMKNRSKREREREKDEEEAVRGVSSYIDFCPRNLPPLPPILSVDLFDKDKRKRNEKPSEYIYIYNTTRTNEIEDTRW